MSISSGAGLSGFEFNSAYAAAKFGLEGWMESLQPEVEPFGITTTIVNPGFFRTDLLTQESATYATPSIADYADRHAERVQWYESMNGQQAGDPAKLARALITIAEPAAAAAPLHRRRRCHRHRRAEGEGPAGAGERLPRPVDLTRTGGLHSPGVIWPMIDLARSDGSSRADAPERRLIRRRDCSDLSLDRPAW